MESISLNVEAVNTHREKPEVGVKTQSRSACAFQGRVTLTPAHVQISIKSADLRRQASAADFFVQDYAEGCVRAQIAFYARVRLTAMAVPETSLGRGVLDEFHVSRVC